MKEHNKKKLASNNDYSFEEFINTTEKKSKKERCVSLFEFVSPSIYLKWITNSTYIYIYIFFFNSTI